MNKVRGFEPVESKHIKNPYLENQEILLPKRGTVQSAGYDFFLQQDVVIPGYGELFIASDVKAYMQENEVLVVHIRSSAGTKKNLRLKNGTGIIDADYYSNTDNDGNIGFFIENTGNMPQYIERGDRIAQGIFMPYLKADDDNENTTRTGGYGHTGN